ncbi:MULTISPECIES: DUF6316 family protein [Pseudomonas]|jgi:hypothetical protein|uniref:DUF6316 domain-containing protein n=3 Tax=Pseudomonas TaxID=286 RepID=A0ABM6QWT4_PSEO1|nr:MULTISPECIES: DUF6316 family protein [Pseudomonas]EIK65119.1 hypothetical protein PflQ8_1592 [Pseudomonas fluorescens Q8r1-96]KIR19141.1 hypothetical protein PFLU4_03550 [Pseudomonas fluorescens]AEA67728.1 Conserved hypothetical protein [Pseudomonas brassicacearum subsp. brassicacearum NFM421]AEV61644.1 thiolase-like protein [Pseudomonas ogarae]ALQ02295.1 hypothetical protein AK973_1846 [Pseudomonas brassicacearum]
MLGKRALDPAPTTIFRSDRICRVNGEFYFNTREGTQEGPFATREAAEVEIEAYIQRMQQLTQVAS